MSGGACFKKNFFGRSVLILTCLILNFSISPAPIYARIQSEKDDQDRIIQEKIKEIEDLKNKIQQLRKAFDIALEKQKKEQKKEIETFSQELDQCKNKLQQAHNVISKENERAKELMDSIGQKQKQTTELEKQIAEKEKILKQQEKIHRAEMLEEKGKFDKQIKNIVEEHEEKINRIEKEKNETGKKVLVCEKDALDFKKQLEKIKDTQAARLETEKELERAKKDLVWIKQELAQSQEVIAQKEVQIYELTQALDASNRQIDKFAAQLKLLQESMTEKNRQKVMVLVEEATGQFNDLIAAYDLKIASLEKENAAAKQKLQNSSQVIIELSQSIDKVKEEELAQGAQKIAELKGKLDEGQRRREELAQKIADYEKRQSQQEKLHRLELFEEKNKFAGQLKQFSASCDEKTAQLKQLLAQIGERDNKVEELTEDLKSKQKEKEFLEAEIIKISSLKEEAKTTDAKSGPEVEEYKQRIVSSEREYAALAEELDKSKSAVNRLEAQLGEAKIGLDERGREIAKLKTALGEKLDENKALNSRLEDKNTSGRENEKMAKILKIKDQESIYLNEKIKQLESEREQNAQNCAGKMSGLETEFSAKSGELTRTLKEKEEQTKMLENEKNRAALELKRQAEENREKLDRVEKENAELKDKLDKASAQISMTQNRLNEKKTTMAQEEEYEKKIAAVAEFHKGEIDKLKNELAVSGQKNQALAQQILALEDRNRTVREESLAKDEQIKLLNKTLEKYDAQSKKIEERFETAKADLENKYKMQFAKITDERDENIRQLKEKMEQYAARADLLEKAAGKIPQEMEKKDLIIVELRKKIGQAKTAMEQRDNKIKELSGALATKEEEVKALKGQLDKIEKDLNQLLTR